MTKNTIAEEHLQLLAEVAERYYEQGLDQSEIAAQLQVSRSSISRMLAEAHELGVVEFRINYPLRRESALEEAISTRYRIPTVYVLNTQGIAGSHILHRIGRLASHHLLSLLEDQMVIGVTWGTTVYEVIAAMPRRPMQGVQVVQVIGSAGSTDPLIDGTDIARQFAEKVSGHYFYLHSPLSVESIYVRSAILSDPNVRKTMYLARRANLLLTGIGSIQPEFSAQLRAGYVKTDDLVHFQNAGAVGEFCGYYIDGHGRVLDIPQNEQVVGISLDDVRKIPQVVAVAAGVAKAATALATLRGELVHTLVLDDQAAAELVRLDGLS